jgi:2-polyprenyl-3-methyl-5-hydroxy-6-metoxy-1,4-benzoquinol methylase
MNINKFLNNNHNFNFNIDISKDQNVYIKNAKSDALHCYSTIFPYLKKDKKILEVGGGIHLLTRCMHDLGYNITSIEPGGFAEYIDNLRIQLTNKTNLRIFTTSLEKFQDQEKFDFIFSMNVLEHTDNIEEHIRCCIRLLKDENSLLFIQCPNYTFPFEPHFYKWFIPFLPKFTFAYFRKTKLIKALGQEEYTGTLKHLNFNCTYFKIKKLNFNIKFIHPLMNIIDRMNQDSVFKERLLKNLIIRICYNIIIFLQIKKVLTYFYPISLCPYLIMKIKK